MSRSNTGAQHVVIEDGAYIGMRASIIAPKVVIIGAKAIVGAASMLNRYMGIGEIVANVPAKPFHKKVETVIETNE